MRILQYESGYLTNADVKRNPDPDALLAPAIPDLLIAATAELAGLVVLHDDKDFALIAGITGQPHERLR